MQDAKLQIQIVTCILWRFANYLNREQWQAVLNENTGHFLIMQLSGYHLDRGVIQIEKS